MNQIFRCWVVTKERQNRVSKIEFLKEKLSSKCQSSFCDKWKGSYGWRIKRKWKISQWNDLRIKVKSCFNNGMRDKEFARYEQAWK